MGLGGTGGREEVARENLELKASGTKLQLVASGTSGRASCFVWLILFIGTEVQVVFLVVSIYRSRRSSCFVWLFLIIGTEVQIM